MMAIKIVEPGIYDVSKLITVPGVSPADPCIYQSERPGGAILRGDGVVRVPNVVLKGFTVDAKLDPTGKFHGVTAGADQVVFDTVTFIGEDIHHGYGRDGKISCKESTNYPGSGVATGVVGPYTAKWINCVIRGNYGAIAINNGASAVIDGCDVRCSFNGIGFSGGAKLDVLNSTFWSHPNHGFAIASPTAVVTFINNVWAVGQNCINAGGNWSGCAEIYCYNNTIWSPDNCPCTDLSGFDLSSCTKVVSVKKNIIVTATKPYLASNPVVPAGLWASDENLYWQWRPRAGRTSSFKSVGPVGSGVNVDMSLAKWRELMVGQDGNSIEALPIFVHPLRYLEPLPTLGTEENGFGIEENTGALLRQWLQLAPTSPGYGKGWGAQPIKVAIPAKLDPPVEWRMLQVEDFLKKTFLEFKG